MRSIIISTYNHKKHVKSVWIENFSINSQTSSDVNFHFNLNENFDHKSPKKSTCPYGSGHNFNSQHNDLNSTNNNYLVHSKTSNLSNKLVPNECNKINQITNQITIRLVYRREVDHYMVFLFLILLNESSIFRRKFAYQFAHLNSSIIVIKYRLNDTPVYPLLKGWNIKIAKLYMNKLRLELSFSWLSTLGGACATLGDKFSDFAHKAAIISTDQLKISLQSGDPYTICRCLIYNTYSLIQRDQLNSAFKSLKRIVYPFIQKYFSRNKESEEFFILKGMYKSASDHYYFKRNQLTKLAVCGGRINTELNGLKRKVLNNLPIVVSS